MSTIIHVGLSVSGFLEQSDEELAACLSSVTKQGGVPFESVREMRRAFLSILEAGTRFVPIGSDCDAFDPEKGCPGHPQP